MPQVVETIGRKPSLLDQLSIVNIIVTLLLALGGGAVSVWITQANTTTRLSAIETQARDAKGERDDIRNKMITRGDFEGLWRTLTDIREDVKEVRAELLRQARERR